jgi:PKD repeat protein
MSIKTLAFFLALMTWGFTLSAQNWAEMMSDPAVNFYEVQNSFEEYWKERDYKEKGKGWKAFKRWEWFTEQRVYPSGDRRQMDQAMAAWFRESADPANRGQRTEVGNWSFLGPSVIPSDGGGAGRCNFLRFDPHDPSILWTGSPGGGLWKSVNGGQSWTNWHTDFLPVIGCTDLAIDPDNTDILYLATGDGYGNDTYTIGVIKSTDGGYTWQPTGLSWDVSESRRIRRLLMHPANSSFLLAATNSGIFVTTDAGETWTLAQNGNFYDLEFKPDDPQIVYGTANQFFRSEDGGFTWSQIETGMPPFNGIQRMEIAVTPADPERVYVVAARNNDYGFYGFYRSNDAGNSFSERATSPNLLGWSPNGGDSGGQGWYDLAIAASPTDPGVVLVGGVNIWRTNNGGDNWSLNAHWYGGGGAPYVHADVHDLIFVPGSGSAFYAACDGGVFRTTNGGSAWTDLSNGLEIAQLYRFSNSATNPELILSGWQDNGSNLKNNNAWRHVLGGDGMECIIDHSNPSVMYGSLYYGYVLKSTNGGNSFDVIVNSDGGGVDSRGLWVTPYVMHPTNPNTLLIGKNELYRSTSGGDYWSALGSLTGNGQIRAIAYAPSNPLHIYASRGNILNRSTNGGITFNNFSSGLPNLTLTYIAVSHTQPGHLWITYSGYSAEQKVFRSVSGGANWVNYSEGLPNIPVNCIVYEKGSNDRVYIGTDAGVWYRDATMAEWVPFSNGLPNVIVNELEIHYATGKLRAATYGRGVWESDLYFKPVAPEAAMTVSPFPVCAGQSLVFEDNSSNNPETRQWSFPGGTPSVSFDAQPEVTFKEAGEFTVVLTVSNAAGSSSVERKITVNAYPEIILATDAPGVCPGGSVTITAAGADNWRWSTGNATDPQIVLTPQDDITVIAFGETEGCESQAEISVELYALPEVSVAATAEGVCIGDRLELQAGGAVSYLWPQLQFIGSALDVQPAETTTYLVQGTSAEGCVGEASIQVEVYPLPVITLDASDPVLCRGEELAITASGAEQYFWPQDDGQGAARVFAPDQSTVFVVQGTSLQGCLGEAEISVQVIDPAVELRYWPDPACFSGMIEVAPLPGVSVERYLIPAGWEEKSGMPEGWIAMTTGAASASLDFHLRYAGLECVRKYALPAWEGTLPEAGYDRCEQVLQSGLDCNGAWYRLQRTAPAGTPLLYSTEAVLTDLPMESLEDHIYLFVCPGSCPRMSMISNPSMGGDPCDQSEFTLQLRPNPVRDLLQVRVLLGRAQRLTLRAWDARGRMVWEDRMEHPGGLQVLQVPVAAWSAGAYILQVEDSASRRRTGKLIVD